MGAAEGLLCGVTTIADHHLNWPREASVDETVALAGATAAAALGVGGRLVFVRGSAGDDADAAAASAEAIHAELIGPAGGGNRRDGRLQLAVGPAGVHSDGRETFEALGDVAARHGLRRRTQANEQVDTAIALERYGRRPIELLREWGWLAPDVTLAHLCDVTEAEIEQLAAAGVTATHAPGCDVPMGWGIAPVAPAAAGRGDRRPGHERRRQQRRRASAGRRPAGDAGLRAGRSAAAGADGPGDGDGRFGGRPGAPRAGAPRSGQRRRSVRRGT